MMLRDPQRAVDVLWRLGQLNLPNLDRDGIELALQEIDEAFKEDPTFVPGQFDIEEKKFQELMGRKIRPDDIDAILGKQLFSCMQLGV